VVRDGGGDRRELKRAADLVRSSGGNLVGFVWNESPQHARSGSAAGPVVPANRPGLTPPEPVGVAATAAPETLSVVENFA